MNRLNCLTCTYLLVLVIFFCTNLNSQSASFESNVHKDYNKLELLDESDLKDLKTFENIFLTNQLAKTSKSNRNLKFIPIKAHIIRDSDGTGGLGKTSINKALSKLNSIFENVSLSFYLYEDLDYIDDTSLNNFKKGNEELLFDAYVEGVINIYFADELINNSNNSICGYNLFDPEKYMVILKNSCALNGSSMAHEIGHFFALSHTHGNENSEKELVDGSNCDTSGDGICDTPADPGLSYENVDDDCNYIGEEKDANGDAYAPDTANVMSYSRKSCRDYFSTMQFVRMYAYYQLIKDDLFQGGIGDSTPQDFVDLKIYPNPVSSGMLYIKRILPHGKPLNYEIINISGQTLSRGVSIDDTINVDRLPSGTYFLSLSNSETRITKKFIK